MQIFLSVPMWTRRGWEMSWGVGKRSWTMWPVDSLQDKGGQNSLNKRRQPPECACVLTLRETGEDYPEFKRTCGSLVLIVSHWLLWNYINWVCWRCVMSWDHRHPSVSICREFLMSLPPAIYCYECGELTHSEKLTKNTWLSFSALKASFDVKC